MAKGSGSLFHPKYAPAGMTYQAAAAAGMLRESPIWWMSYYRDGKKIRENTGTTKEQEARRLLNARLGLVVTGAPVLPRADKVTYEQAKADLLAYYATHGERDVIEATRRLKHLDGHFGARRLVSIGPDDCTAYAAKRRGVGAANGTINRELNVLGRLLSLAVENKKLLVKPIVRKLDEAPPRAGFFERDMYQAVVKHLPEDLQCACAIMHTFGWRKMEVLDLERRQLDLVAGTLRLDPGETKNGEGRTIHLTPEVKAMLTAQVARVKALERKLGKIIPHLFPHLVGAKAQSQGARHVAVLGEKIGDFRRAWRRACKLAGCPGMLRHDFRRTAVRNMEQAGVPRSVAMKVTGHKTENIYRRYAIVSPADLKRASDLLAQASK
jgi:integrase